MAKQMKFTYGDKEYTLEFTRRTVTEMERNAPERWVTFLSQLSTLSFLTLSH